MTRGYSTARETRMYLYFLFSYSSFAGDWIPLNPDTRLYAVPFQYRNLPGSVLIVPRSAYYDINFTKNDKTPRLKYSKPEQDPLFLAGVRVFFSIQPFCWISTSHLHESSVSTLAHKDRPKTTKSWPKNKRQSEKYDLHKKLKKSIYLNFLLLRVHWSDYRVPSSHISTEHNHKNSSKPRRLISVANICKDYKYRRPCP